MPVVRTVHPEAVLCPLLQVVQWAWTVLLADKADSDEVVSSYFFHKQLTDDVIHWFNIRRPYLADYGEYFWGYLLPYIIFASRKTLEILQKIPRMNDTKSINWLKVDLESYDNLDEIMDLTPGKRFLNIKKGIVFNLWCFIRCVHHP